MHPLMDTQVLYGSTVPRPEERPVRERRRERGWASREGTKDPIGPLSYEIVEAW